MDKWFNDIAYWIQSWNFELRLTVTLGLAAIALYFFSKVNNTKEAKLKPIPFILFIVFGAMAFFAATAGPVLG